MRTSVIHRRTAILYSCAVLAVVLPGGGRANNRPSGRATATGRCIVTTSAGTGSSPLAQINATNVGTLTRSWTYGLQAEAPPAPTGRGGALNSEATPIVVNGVMYLPAAGRIVALQPETGKEVWRSR